MTSNISVLAAATDVGEMVGYAVIPIIGLVLLIVGLVKRSKSGSPQPNPPYGWAPGQAPYGSQPPPPGGYPGYPQQPGYPPPHPQQQPYFAPGMQPPYPPPGYPPFAPKPKKQGTGLIVAGAIILALGLLGNIGRLATSSSPNSSSSERSSSSASSTTARSDDGLDVGDCVIDIPATGPFEVVDCSNPAAQLELGAIEGPDQCPDGPASLGAYLYQPTSAGRTRCFLPNFEEGNCFRVDSVQTMFNKVDCTDPNAAGKVETRLDSNDPGACTPPARALAFPEPARTYCLTQHSHT
ncbi:hypothetical protein AB0K11_14435 [Mycobacterium sp. NPDC050551]|uniref:hypothetical protein n=1 Tax=Mycobacterium sp. NPDC050551 TaxID=3155407 RepID=UPI0034287472